MLKKFKAAASMITLSVTLLSDLICVIYIDTLDFIYSKISI